MEKEIYFKISKAEKESLAQYIANSLIPAKDAFRIVELLGKLQMIKED